MSATLWSDALCTVYTASSGSWPEMAAFSEEVAVIVTLPSFNPVATPFALTEITDWFKGFQGGEDMQAMTRDHIRRYTARARELGLDWAVG